MSMEDKEKKAAPLAGVIHEYTQNSHLKHHCYSRENELKEQMDAHCNASASNFRKRVKDLFPADGKWTLFDVNGHALVNHGHNPVRISTTISVKAGYYDDEQRGSIELYGDLGKEDELFEELNRLLNGDL